MSFPPIFGLVIFGRKSALAEILFCKVHSDSVYMQQQQNTIVAEAQLVRALLANSKVPGSSPGGVTEDFFLLFFF